MNPKPIGSVKVVGLLPSDIGRDQGKVAVNAHVLIEDGSDKQWTFLTSYFVHEMKPYCSAQTLGWTDWLKTISSILGKSWNRKDLDWNNISSYEKEYRASKTP